MNIHIQRLYIWMLKPEFETPGDESWTLKHNIIGYARGLGINCTEKYLKRWYLSNG